MVGILVHVADGDQVPEVGAAVDLLVTGPDLVTMDDHGSVMRDGAIAVRGNEICWIGPMAEADFAAEEVIHRPGSIAHPGLIDSHFHTAQHFLRGVIATDRRSGQLDLPIWKHYLVPFEARLSPEDVRLSAEIAYAELLAAGTTCVADAGGPHPDEMAKAALDTGIRAFVSRSTADQGDLPPPMVASTDENIDQTASLLDRWPNTRNGRVSAWASLRQILVCSDDLCRAIDQLAAERGVRVHTHLCEGSYEIDYAAARWRCRPGEHLTDIGVFNDRLHTAHAILLSDSEVDLYRDLGASVAHCPMQNYVIGPGKVPHLVAGDVAVGLGTDGAVFNPALDLLATARVANVAAQAVHGTPSHVQSVFGPEQLLAMATGDRARTVGLAGRLGRLAVGCLADFVIHDVGGLESIPGVDPLVTLVESLGRHSVETVVVDGTVVIRAREHQLVDVEGLVSKAARRVPTLLAETGTHPRR
ncbi:MAG: amidohydrolase family protein [Acidimicrobiales bacterium]